MGSGSKAQDMSDRNVENEVAIKSINTDKKRSSETRKDARERLREEKISLQCCYDSPCRRFNILCSSSLKATGSSARKMLGGIDESQIEVDLSTSIPSDSDGTDRDVESLGVLGAGLEAFDEDGDDDDCEETGGNSSKNNSMFLLSLSWKERGGESV